MKTHDGDTDEVAGPLADEQSRYSVRISPHGYLIAVFLGSFVSAFLFYIGQDAAAVASFLVSWVVVPYLALSDRIYFDGKAIYRSGGLPRLWAVYTGRRYRIRLRNVEGVETQAIRTIRRSGLVYYRYRTVFREKGQAISVASGGEDYRRFIRAVLSGLPDDVLDTRSIEIRDHMGDPKEALMRAEFSRIPSHDVLVESFAAAGRRLPSKMSERMQNEVDASAEDLRELANELRMSGYISQALEAFRRALVLRPKDAWLLFEFARCLHSFAGIHRDPKLQRRALAASRLLERRAMNDGELLVRLGEWYFQIGEPGRAAQVFRDTLERLGDNFHAARGLAEIALSEGKIAHVIHHFSTAARAARRAGLRRWSRGESVYFANLQADEEYMELEVSRVSMLDTVERSKRTSLRIGLAALPLICAGVLLENDLLAQIGWAVSGVALLIWTALIGAGRMLSRRLPYEMLADRE